MLALTRTFELELDCISKVSLLILNLEILAEVFQECRAVEDSIRLGLGEVDVELLLRAGGLGGGFRLHTRKVSLLRRVLSKALGTTDHFASEGGSGRSDNARHSATGFMVSTSWHSNAV